jgi:glycosyltransferase involved in cell wall biosynthesis
VTPDEIPEQSASHHQLLVSSRSSRTSDRFDAIVVPTNRPVESLTACMALAREADVPLIVICSKLVNQGEVKDMAAAEGVQAYAFDLPDSPANPLGITFATSSDEQLAAASSVRTRDLSPKRNLGLVIARMLGWRRLMFLDDDIYGITGRDVDALAGGLSTHGISVLIPDEFPDNSVACHANRLGGREQDVFASAGGMGVRCDRDDLAFFPNIYNEDWFFFFEEATSQKIIEVGTSKQRTYDPFADPDRAVKEEFGDLLAEGLYAPLDHHQGLLGVDAAYWEGFIDKRKQFHARVATLLADHSERQENTDLGHRLRAAGRSVAAAQGQLASISPELCRKFVALWQADLVEWRRYLTKLGHFDAVGDALDHLGLDYAELPSPRTR